MAPFSKNETMGMMLAGSAAFFVVTMSEIFVFDTVPTIGDWPQVVVVPLVAMGLQYMWGPRLDPIIDRLVLRRSRIFLGLFVLWWMLMFVPFCVIVYLVS